MAGAEDREFCYRWLRSGGRLRFVPNAVVEHFHDLTLRSYWHQHFQYGRGEWIFRRTLAADDGATMKRPTGLLTGLLLSAGREGRGWAVAKNLALLTLSRVAYFAGLLHERLASAGGAKETT